MQGKGLPIAVASSCIHVFSASLSKVHICALLPDRFVLLTSLLTNAKAIGQQDNNNYKFLNAFGGVLDNKLEAEKQLRASGSADSTDVPLSHFLVTDR